MSVKTFKYRLYPERSQETLFERTLDACRWVYNKTLEAKDTAWKERKESIGLYDTNKLLTDWKKENPWLSVAHSQSLQNAQVRVDLAFKAFFRQVKGGAEDPGYPNFRGRRGYDSWTYPQAGFKLKDGVLWLSRIGDVKIILHRPLEGEINTLTIRRTATGDWYACFSCEVPPLPLPHTPKAVGVDVGLESFATLSTGEKIENPRFFRKDEKELAKAQRKFDKAPRGSPERKKWGKVVAKIHKRTANRRADFAHKLSRRLVNENGSIALEDLNVEGMLKNHCLAKSISDAAWSQFRSFTEYKATFANRKIAMVDPRNTSRACSQCGALVEKDLGTRVHSCPHCGLILDRDQNAAINILRLGLQTIGNQSVEAHEL